MNHGSTGVILFYLELHRATGERSFLDIAVRGGDALLDDLVDTSDDSVAIYSGLPSSMFVLDELALASGEQQFRGGAAAATGRIVERAQPLGAGGGWSEVVVPSRTPVAARLHRGADRLHARFGGHR